MAQGRPCSRVPDWSAVSATSPAARPWRRTQLLNKRSSDLTAADASGTSSCPRISRCPCPTRSVRRVGSPVQAPLVSANGCSGWIVADSEKGPLGKPSSGILRVARHPPEASHKLSKEPPKRLRQAGGARGIRDRQSVDGRRRCPTWEVGNRLQKST